MEAEDDVAESWEDVADDELERRMEEREHVQQAKESRESVSQPAVDWDEVPRTRRREPQIQLLKRDPSQQHKALTSEDQQQGKAVKSLAEREAEYMEARARIMGKPTGSIPVQLKNITSPEKPVSTNPSNISRSPRAPSNSKGFDNKKR